MIVKGVIWAGGALVYGALIWVGAVLFLMHVAWGIPVSVWSHGVFQ